MVAETVSRPKLVAAQNLHKPRLRVRVKPRRACQHFTNVVKLRSRFFEHLGNGRFSEFGSHGSLPGHPGVSWNLALAAVVDLIFTQTQVLQQHQLVFGAWDATYDEFGRLSIVDLPVTLQKHHLGITVHLLAAQQQLPQRGEHRKQGDRLEDDADRFGAHEGSIVLHAWACAPT